MKDADVLTLLLRRNTIVLAISRRYCLTCDIVRAVVAQTEVTEMCCPACGEPTQDASGVDARHDRMALGAVVR